MMLNGMIGHVAMVAAGFPIPELEPDPILLQQVIQIHYLSFWVIQAFLVVNTVL
jgi:hypothetical protein